MFRSIVMTYRLHVHDMFDGIPITAVRGQVNSLFKFCVSSLVSMLFIIFGIFLKFWAEA